VLSFEVEGGIAAAAAVMANVRLITPAVSLGAVGTLIEHPAGLTHRFVDSRVREAAGITDGLLRLSVGLEDVQTSGTTSIARSRRVASAPPLDFVLRFGNSPSGRLATLERAWRR
jgi:methionine-gamma-lyase